jgi:hypothetical protein
MVLFKPRGAGHDMFDNGGLVANIVRCGELRVASMRCRFQFRLRDVGFRVRPRYCKADARLFSA